MTVRFSSDPARKPGFTLLKGTPVFDLVDGLPLHPLVVHAVVVLLPLAAIGTVILAVRPVWRVTYGPLLLIVAAVATAAIPIATSSGEALERHVGDPGRHAHLGDQLIWFALPLLILDAAMVWMARQVDQPLANRSDHRNENSARRINSVIAALALVVALTTAVQVYRVGESGARAAWADQVTSK